MMNKTDAVNEAATEALANARLHLSISKCISRR